MRDQPQHVIEGGQPVGCHQRQPVAEVDDVAHLAPPHRPKFRGDFGREAPEGTVSGAGCHRAASTKASKSADPRDPAGPDGRCQSAM